MKYRSTMTEGEKYWHDEGFYRGQSIAETVAPDAIETPDGTLYDVGTGALLNWEDMISELYECESNDRQFSPFEFTAKEINESDYPDEYWEAYDQGISEGILTTMENWQA